MDLKRIGTLDWDGIAGVIAAVAAVVLHLLHVIDESVLLTIAVVLIALLFLRDLRQERATEEAFACVDDNRNLLRSIKDRLTPADVVLIGPGHLRAASERFSARASGEMIWFNVCLSMFRPQSLFDVLLRPAIENPHVTSITFVLDERQKRMWEEDVMPKVAMCKGSEKVTTPHWTTLDQPDKQLCVAEFGLRRRITAASFYTGELERDPRYAAAYTREDFYRDPSHVPPTSSCLPREPSRS